VIQERAEQEILSLFVNFHKGDEIKNMFLEEPYKEDLSKLSNHGLGGIEQDNSIRVIYEEALRLKQPQPTAFLMMMEFPAKKKKGRAAKKSNTPN
jgi:hypothetical protein